MKPKVRRRLGAVWLGVAGLGLAVSSPLPAQAPKLRATFKGHTDEVLAVAFSPDGKTLASGSRDKTIRLWEVASGKEMAALEGHVNWVTSVAFSPDGKALVSGSADGSIRLWGVATGKETGSFRGDRQCVLCVAFSPDGKTVASGGYEPRVKLWDVAGGKQRAALELPAPASDISSVAVSPDGKTLASGSRFLSDVSSGEVVFWDLPGRKAIATARLQTRNSWVRAVAFSRDGKALAVGVEGPASGEVKLLDGASGKTAAALRGHTKGVRSVAFAPDAKSLSSAGVDGTIRVWDTAQEHRYAGGSHRECQFRGLQPGRHDPGLGGCGQDRQALGHVSGQAAGRVVARRTVPAEERDPRTVTADQHHSRGRSRCGMARWRRQTIRSDREVLREEAARIAAS
jgi:WD40 repeat protein